VSEISKSLFFSVLAKNKLPIGSILIMKTNTAPFGYLICDGTNIDASLYPSELIPYLTSDFVIGASGFGNISEILDTSSDSVGDVTLLLTDGDSDTKWTPNSFQSEYSIAIQLSEPVSISGYEIFTSIGNRFKKYAFYGSNDNINYTLIDNQISQSYIYGNEKLGKVFTNENQYLYYKFVFTPTASHDKPIISDVLLYIDAYGETIYALPVPEDINPSYDYVYKYLIKAY